MAFDFDMGNNCSSIEEVEVGDSSLEEGRGKGRDTLVGKIAGVGVDELGAGRINFFSSPSSALKFNCLTIVTILVRAVSIILSSSFSISSHSWRLVLFLGVASPFAGFSSIGWSFVCAIIYQI